MSRPLLCSLSFALFLCASVNCPHIVCAQLGGGAFNPHCYYPIVGDPAEIDTIFGAKPQDFLGNGLINIGPRPEESFGDIATVIRHGVLFPPIPSFDGGPSFQLHPLKSNHRIRFYPEGTLIKFGHFRDSYHTDMLVSEGGIPRLYWEDDRGDYDSTRWTKFAAPIGQGYGTIETQPFAAHLSSDSVLDIAYVYQGFNHANRTQDTLFFTVIPGASNLYQPGQTLRVSIGAYYRPERTPDSLNFVYVRAFESHLSNDGPGVILQEQSGNLFYYHRSLPFNIQEFARALAHDTLISASLIPDYQRVGQTAYQDYPACFEMIATPKSSGDSSSDLFVPMAFTGHRFWTYLYRGGPNFQGHALTLDSAAFVLESPAAYGVSILDQVEPTKFADCGDMTGRGNHVLCAEYIPQGGFANFCFYELGDQLDDKIDMFYSDGPGGGGSIDTITANADRLQDVVIGESNRYDYDLLPGEAFGTIHILYGTSRIPTRETNRVSQSYSMNTGLIAYPNPATSHRIDLKVGTSQQGRYRLTMRSLLGSVVLEREVDLCAGSVSLTVTIPPVPLSTYSLELVRGGERKQTLLIVAQ